MSLCCYTRKAYAISKCFAFNMENGGRIFFLIKIKRLNKCRKKQTIYQIMLRDLKFLRYWWSCLTFYWFALHETLILLSCCVFIEMVNCLNTIILKSFLIIVFTSIVHLFYRTIIPPKIFTTHILSIEFSILLLVTSWIM